MRFQALWLRCVFGPDRYTPHTFHTLPHYQPKVTHEAWKSAMMRASGEKVLDDPKLLRKSLKKEQKRKEKSAKGWQERTQKQQEQVQARQTK